MKNLFMCPHCDAVLNPSVKILLVAMRGGRRGMILLSPQPGNFKYICDSSLEDAFTPGDLVAFSCPVCTADLTARTNHRFVELLLRRAGYGDRRIQFSRAFGTHATYLIDGDETKAFGDDADGESPTNFFGA